MFILIDAYSRHVILKTKKITNFPDKSCNLFYRKLLNYLSVLYSYYFLHECISNLFYHSFHAVFLIVYIDIFFIMFNFFADCQFYPINIFITQISPLFLSLQPPFLIRLPLLSTASIPMQQAFYHLISDIPILNILFFLPPQDTPSQVSFLLL